MRRTDQVAIFLAGPIPLPLIITVLRSGCGWTRPEREDWSFELVRSVLVKTWQDSTMPLDGLSRDRGTAGGSVAAGAVLRFLHI